MPADPGFRLRSMCPQGPQRHEAELVAKGNEPVAQVKDDAGGKALAESIAQRPERGEVLALTSTPATVPSALSRIASTSAPAAVRK